ncbi:DEAD/DEAH box helicase family protein [Waddlia chondrophila]|uniref:Uncharacterized protein n=1 Tax=Waddlia chondrophila (strain ATCC VR-1470 / WSU 86-1044) TaxID=716544 RepID=D6YV45_WADCW|nr:DEAD/DEAH box helicase family protein [Waddlia chondrophila]ADI38006.1 hypothetical protein wcw_0638 [Waddlia chondrophila WSU 86-1044]
MNNNIQNHIFNQYKSLFTSPDCLLTSPKDKDSVERIRQIWEDRRLDLLNAEIESSLSESLPDCPMSEEDLLKYSLLETLEIGEFPPGIKELMHAKKLNDAIRAIAANFAAGGLTTGGKENPFNLDGFPSPQPNFIVWEWLLSNLKASMDHEDSEDLKTVNHLLTGIAQLKEYTEDLDQIANSRNGEDYLHQIALKYTGKVHALNPGESQCFYGGWSNVGGGSGHALIYEFKRNEDQSFEVFLYTATGYQLTDQMFAGDKIRIKPYIQFTQVPEDLICLNGDGILRPAFFQHMIELKALSKWDNNFVVDEEDVLEVFDHLEKFRKTVDWEESGAITGQRAGTCVPSSTKAWMRRNSGNLARYKQILLHLNFRLIVATYRSLKDDCAQDTKEGAVSRRLVNHLSRNFLRTIAKALDEDHSGGYLVDPQLAEQTQATIYHILKEIEFDESEIKISRKKSFVESRITELTLDQRVLRKVAQRTIKATQMHGNDTAPSLVIIPDPLVISRANQIPEAVEAFRKLYITYGKKENRDVVVNMQLSQLIDQLPLPQVTVDERSRLAWIQKVQAPFWENLTIKEIEEILKSFSVLIDLYSQTHKNEQPTRYYATLLSLHTLSHYLAVKIDTRKADDSPNMPRLEGYPVPHFGSLTEELEALVFIETSEFNRVKSACDYFKSFDAHTNNRHQLFNNENNTEVVKTTVKESPLNGQYWQSLLTADEALTQDIDALADQKWKSLTEDEIERIYESDVDRYQKQLARYHTYMEWRGKKNNYDTQFRRFQLGLSKEAPEPFNEPEPPYEMEPAKPQKRVNLPQSTKRTLILEESVALDDSNPLIARGYSHVVWLRVITYRMDLALHGNFTYIRLNKYNFKAERKSPYSCEAFVKKPGSSKQMSKSTKKRMFDLQHRAQSETQIQFYEQKVASRHKSEWDRIVAEGSTLKSTALVHDHPVLKELLRSASEWRLTPYQMIRVLNENKMRLADPKLQAIIFRLLLRCPISEKGTHHLGFAEVLKEDPSYLDSCHPFIQTGLNHFFNMRKQMENKEDRPSDAEGNPVDGARFFLEFAFYTSKYLIDAKMGLEKQLIDTCLQSIQRWLDLEDLKPTEKAIIHQYRLLFFSLYPQNESVSVYESWISYQMYPDSGAWHSPILQSHLNRYLTQFTSELFTDLSNDNHLQTSLGNGVLEALKLKNPETVIGWTFDVETPNLLKGISNNGEEWDIDLISGVVYGPSGKIGWGMGHFPWESQQDFIRLFKGERGFSYTSIGNSSFTFHHPKMGIIRLMKSNEFGRTFFAIQKQFPGFEGNWFELKSTEKLNGYPRILSYDHTYWIPTNGSIRSPSGHSINGLFATLDKHDLNYASIDDGAIIEFGLDPHNQELIEGLHVDMYEVERDGMLSRFDVPDHILAYKRENAFDSDLVKVVLPRYTSQEGGNPLVFRYIQGKMIWSENTQYALPERMPKGFLGTIPNYLYLESLKSTETDKLLVPFQTIESQSIPAADGTLSIESLVPPIDSSNGEQWGRYQYFVYNIINGKVTSTTLEGQLFLSYLSLSQKNYREAVKGLREIKPTQKLTPQCEKIIDLILSSPFGEDDPNSRAVYLHAESLSITHREKQSTTKIEEFYPGQEGLTKLWGTIVRTHEYLQSLNNVDLACRLSFEQEHDLLLKLLQEGKTKRDLIFKAEPLSIGAFDGFIQQLERRLELLETQSYKLPKVGSYGERTLPDSDTNGRYRQPFCQQIDFDLPYQFRVYDLEIYKRLYGDAAEQEMLEAQEVYERYLEQLQHSVAWLSHGSNSTLCTRPSKHVGLKKNGAMLLEVHRIAKEESIDARRETVYRLWQWRLHSNGVKDNIMQLDLMIHILLEPEKYPDPLHLSNSPSSEQKRDYLNHLKKAYDNWRDEISGSQTLKCVQNFLSPPQEIIFEDRTETGHYPIPTRSALALQSNLLPQPSPLNFSFPSNDERWLTLRDWKSRFLTPPNDQEVTNYEDFKFDYQKSLLNPGEDEYEKTVANDLFALRQEYLSGKKQNERKIQWNITKDHAKELMIQSGLVKQQLEIELKEKMQTLLHAANQASDHLHTRQAEFASIGGGTKQRISFSHCLELVLSFDSQGLKQLNPNLSEQEINKIASMTIEIEDLKSYLAQTGQIHHLARQIKKIDNVNDPTRRYLCQQLTDQLEAEYYFESFEEEKQVHAALRVFSGQTGMIPHKKQADLIKKMLEMEEENPERYKDIIIQLIMGGGKTSVLATIILYLAAKRKGRLALFIVPPSLFSTVETNISESIWNAFQKHVQSIDLNREDLTLYKLDQLIEQLEQAQQKQQPIVVKATTLQTLELELLYQGRLFKKYSEKQKHLLEKQKECLRKKEELTSWLLMNQHQQSVEVLRKQDKLKQLTAVLNQLEQALEAHRAIHHTSKLKIMKLAEVTKRFATQCDALMDEVDLLLDCLQEVNFPDGETVPIDPTTNSLIHTCFKALVSKKLMVDEQKKISVADVVRLEENAQTLMDTHRYLNKIIPVVSKYLFDSFEPIKNFVPEEFQESFIRYASNQIPSILQEYADDEGRPVDLQVLKEAIPNWDQLGYSLEMAELDIAFLRYLEHQYHAKDEESQKGTNLIALTRHLLNDILPATLSKSGCRSYGPSLKDKSLTIIPYIGVHAPATTQFGYYLEEACYYYQWIAGFPIQEQDVLNVATTAESAARYYVEKNREKFEQTVEYQEFYKLFGITLDQVKDPEMLKRAVFNISQDVEKRLDFQFEIVAEKVGFRSERLTSNGRHLLRQVNTRRTMSGTPWNAGGYDRKLFNRLEHDIGTEGKILHTMAKKAKEGQIHEVDFQTVEDFLTQIFHNHPDPIKIRGIIETGGIFKAFEDNAQVARQIMECLANWQNDGRVDASIEGVLFFHRDSGQEQSDTLYVWKKGANQPERIGGSSKETLRARGLDPSKYFVYYDERHTTGVDILQLPEAVNLLTFDEKMLRRTIGQGTMRLRQYLYEQNVELVVTKGTRQLIINGGGNLEDFILSAEKNQSMRKTDHMVRYFRQQIEASARDLAVERITDAALLLDQEGSEDAFIEEVGKNEPFYVTKMSNQFYLSHGKLESKVETKEMLAQQLKQKVEAFTDQINDHKARESILKEQEELSKHIQNATCLPEQSTQRASSIGIEQEVEMRVEFNVEDQIMIENELEQEIRLELEHYERLPRQPLLKEEKMDRKTFLTLIQTARKQEEIPMRVVSLQRQLASYSYGLFEDRFHYENAFREPIYGTHAFFHTVEGEVLPVFHQTQRPPQQVLAIQVAEDQFCWLLLSEREANAARKHLLKMYAENAEDSNSSKEVEGVWLVQLDGSSFATGTDHSLFPLEEECVERGIFELNAFAGNAHYLDQYPLELEAWMGEDDDLKIRFLKLRTARDERQRSIIQRNPVINRLDQKATHNPGHHLFKKRAEQEKQYKGRLRIDDEVGVKLLSPKKLRHLHVDEVPHLGIDWELKETDDVTQKTLGKLIERIPEKNRDNLDATLKKKAEKLTQDQFRYLQPFQVPFLTKKQIKWLPPSKIQYLEHPEQICDHSQENWTYYLSEEQVAQLRSSQKHLIPYVNPLFYPTFSQSWQIQAIDPKYVALIPENKWQWLSKKQVKNLPQETNKESFRSLNIPQKFSWIHGNLLRNIPLEYLHKVCQEQIQEITDPELIVQLEQIAQTFTGKPEIEKGLWTSWISKEMVPFIDFKSQLRFLNHSEQIRAVPNEQIRFLDPATQVPLITESSQVKLLEGEAQIQACPKELISHLEGDQLNYLSFDQIPFLKLPHQIQALTDPKRFSHLTAVESLEQKTVNQMTHITEDQLALVTETQVQGLSNHQLLTLKQRYPDKWEEISDGLVEAQVSTFDSQALIDLLSPEQINKWLCKDQVKFLLIKEQVASCPDHLVKELLPLTQVPLIEQRQAKFLVGKRQVQVIKSPQIFEGLKASQMKWIDDLQIPWVNPSHVKGLNNDQLLKKFNQVDHWIPFQQELVRSQIETFDNQELIDLLSEEQVTNDLLKTQVKFLQQPWQIRACPVKQEWIHEMDAKQVPHLINDQHISLLKKEQIGWLIPTQIHGLTNEQLLQLHPLKSGDEWPDFRDRLTAHQINCFDSQELIDLLAADQIHDHLSDVQVPFLQEPWQVQACPDELVKHLDPETQVPHISKNQVPYLEGEEQVQHCPAEKAWVQKFTKKQFQYLTDEQITLLSEDQISQMDCLDELKRLSPLQIHAVNPDVVANFDDALVERLQVNENAYPLIERVRPEQIHLIRNRRAAEHLTAEQVANVTIEQVNTLESRHPLWGRVEKPIIDALEPEKIQYLASSRLRYLTNAKQIKQISFWRVKHLTRDQLKSRSWGQFLAYTVGVIVLGVVSCLAALVAYTSLIPFIIFLANRGKGKYVMKKINTNPHRLYRYFEVYLSPQAA